MVVEIILIDMKNKLCFYPYIYNNNTKKINYILTNLYDYSRASKKS